MRAFTLIELLIVVAIIAILAAIAVPNFLEAQVRAKVTRAKADMRSVATAIESYAVDTNIYPYGIIQFLAPREHANWGFLPEALSTPVAYLSALPVDDFNLDYWIPNGGPSRTTAAHPHARYRLTTRKPWPGPGGFYTPNPLHWLNPSVPGNYAWILRRIDAPANAPFILVSPGPDRTEDTIPGYSPKTYDPSNGTISGGDVTYIGGGGAFR